PSGLLAVRMPVADGRFGFLQLDGDASRLALAEAQAIVAQPYLDRVAERGKAEHFDLFPLHQAHFQQPLAQCIAPLDSLDRGPLTNQQLIEGSHQGSSWRVGWEDKRGWGG